MILFNKKFGIRVNSFARNLHVDCHPELSAANLELEAVSKTRSVSVKS